MYFYYEAHRFSQGRRKARAGYCRDWNFCTLCMRHNYRSESCTRSEINDRSRKCLALCLSAARSSPFNWEQGPLCFIVQHAKQRAEYIWIMNSCDIHWEVLTFRSSKYGLLRGHCLTVTEHGNKPHNSTHILFWRYEIKREDGKLKCCTNGVAMFN